MVDIYTRHGAIHGYKTCKRDGFVWIYFQADHLSIQIPVHDVLFIDYHEDNVNLDDETRLTLSRYREEALAVGPDRTRRLTDGERKAIMMWAANNHAAVDRIRLMAQGIDDDARGLFADPSFLDAGITEIKSMVDAIDARIAAIRDLATAVPGSAAVEKASIDLEIHRLNDRVDRINSYMQTIATTPDGSIAAATSEVLREIGDLKQQRRHMKHQQSHMVARS
jgi:hypothetical protein